MPKFGFEKIKVVTGRQNNVLQLSVDEISQLDEFEKELAGTQYLSQLRSLLTWIDYYSNTGKLPENKFKELKKDKKEKVKEFEFRTKDLRLYGIMGDGGRIIIFCGYKSSQVVDLKKFRLLKSRVLAEKY